MAVVITISVALEPSLGDAAPFVAWFGAMIPVSILLSRIEKRHKRKVQKILDGED